MSDDEIEKLLKIHQGSESLDFGEIWEKGTFIFDTNVLLDLYRLPQSASKDLMMVLENSKFENKIWIGFQVALEFINNRFDAISDQKNKFSDVRNIVEKAISAYAEVRVNLESDLGKLRLKQRHSAINPDQYINSKSFENSTSFLSDFLSALEGLDVSQGDVTDRDLIKDFIFSNFSGKIGKSFDQDKLNEIFKEGENRYQEEIPPGYKDKKKDGFYTFDGKRYLKKFGDLVLWKEIIEKANAEKLEYIVLVTGDVKEDWWAERRGKRLGPRKELLDEIYQKASSVKVFHMYDTSGFLQYAKDHIDKSIKESSISEVESLIAVNRVVDVSGVEQYALIAEVISQVSKSFPDLHVSIGNSVRELPPLSVDFPTLWRVFAELLSNVLQHCEDKNVSVRATSMSDQMRIRLINRMVPRRPDLESAFLPDESFVRDRGLGLDYIRSVLQDKGIDVQVGRTATKFIVDIFFPIRFFNEWQIRTS